LDEIACLDGGFLVSNKLAGRKVILIIGTRPEAIKIAPVVHALLNSKELEPVLVVTGQHREMIDPILSFFDLLPDFDFNLIEQGLSPNGFAGECLKSLDNVFIQERPMLALVHGDTLTSSIGAFAAFQRGIKVAHLEAGLRTYNKQAPFPEEVNRQITARVADIHFAPTNSARSNLMSERISDENIFVIGNTVIAAIRIAKWKLEHYESPRLSELKSLVDPSKKLILVTGHRRESFGEGIRQICVGLRILAANTDIQIVYPVHLNPNVKSVVSEELEGIENLHLIEPVGYPEFVWLMLNSYLILSDSGGIQEEASFLGKPLLITREITERPEVIENGAAFLVGTESNKIVIMVEKLIKDSDLYRIMSTAGCPFGDGHSSERVEKILSRL